MLRRDPNKTGLRNKIFDMFFESYVNGCRIVTLDELFYTLRTMPAIIDKDRYKALKLLRHSAYETCEELRKCGVLITIGYNCKHHHEVVDYKPFDNTNEDILRLKVMQRRRVNRVKATEHITMDQIKLAVDAGMSIEAYKGSCIIEKAKVIMVVEHIGNSL